MAFVPHPDSLGPRLDREWARLRHHPRSLRRVRSWTALDPAGRWSRGFAELTDLQVVLDRTRGGGAGDAAADALLCGLIGTARLDALAGRIVIQRILPGLIARARRYRDFNSETDPIEIIVAAAWIALHEYDCARRGRFVAPALISDATFQAFRRPLRRMASTEEARSPHAFVSIEAADGPTNAPDELAAVLETATAAGVPAGDVELVCRLVRADSPVRVAEHYGVTPRTIRNRRDAAVSRIRSAVAA